MKPHYLEEGGKFLNRYYSNMPRNRQWFLKARRAARKLKTTFSQKGNTIMYDAEVLTNDQLKAMLRTKTGTKMVHEVVTGTVNPLISKAEHERFFSRLVTLLISRGLNYEARVITNLRMKHLMSEVTLEEVAF